MFLLLTGCLDSDLSEVGFDFPGGDFQFYTVIAKDQCLGGAMRALFMPEGPDERHPFQYPIYIPSFDEVPMSYDVDFREPFLGMPVTVEDGGEGLLQVRGSVMEAVVLDESKYGDCTVTMSVDADLIPTDTDFVEGEGRISVSDPRGEEELCPTFDGDPCDVTLSLECERI